MDKEKTLKINDSVWNDSAPIMEYKIIGKQEFTASNNKKTTLFEAKCLACKHGFDCEILIGLDDCGEYEYKSMLNDDEDDRQFYFHSGNNFKKTLQEAIISKGKKHISDYEKEITKAENDIRWKKERIADINIEVATLEKELLSQQTKEQENG